MLPHARRTFTRLTAIFCFAGTGLLGSRPVAAAAPEFPPIPVVKKVVSGHFAKMKDYQPNDLISRRDVAPIFKELARKGWEVSDQKQFLTELLDDSDDLVGILSSKQGKAFMRKVSRQPSVYDRLDRIVREEDGAALLRKVVSLPDGHKYAGAQQRPGTPTLSDLLLISKRGSAHKRKLKDFNKPTGMRYTADAFWKRLLVSYNRDRKRLK